MINENFVYLGAFIAILGGFSYLVDTIKGKVKPNRISYLLWSLAPLIAFAAEMKQGVGTASVLTFTVGFIPLLIFISSFFNKKSEWKITKFDLVCGTLSLCGLVFWYVTRIGNVAIFFSIIADGLASLPTIIKSYKYPETEAAWPYFSATISAAITLLTIKKWTFASYGFPLYIIIMTLIISSIVKLKIGKKLS